MAATCITLELYPGTSQSSQSLALARMIVAGWEWVQKRTSTWHNLIPHFIVRLQILFGNSLFIFFKIELIFTDALFCHVGMRSIHMEHAYDFYKPNMSSEYPVVDGKLSVRCYFHALDQCYKKYTDKGRTLHQKTQFTLDDIDYAIFHTPFCRIVQKSLARLMFHDFLCSTESSNSESEGDRYAGLLQFRYVCVYLLILNEMATFLC